MDSRKAGSNKSVLFIRGDSWLKSCCENDPASFFYWGFISCPDVARIAAGRVGGGGGRGRHSPADWLPHVRVFLRAAQHRSARPAPCEGDLSSPEQSAGCPRVLRFDRRASSRHRSGASDRHPEDGHPLHEYYGGRNAQPYRTALLRCSAVVFARACRGEERKRSAGDDRLSNTACGKTGGRYRSGQNRSQAGRTGGGGREPKRPLVQP